MKQLFDTVWQRRGVSWIWDDEALNKVAKPGEVFSLRELLRFERQWPDDLPSNNGDIMVVAGLDACLDLMSPAKLKPGWATSSSAQSCPSRTSMKETQRSCSGSRRANDACKSRPPATLFFGAAARRTAIGKSTLVEFFGAKHGNIRKRFCSLWAQRRRASSICVSPEADA
jgi:hypothetical protein